jgi:Uma2 family endonuclease
MSLAPSKPVMPGVQPESEAAVPLLENGDRLTRDEFERRYLAMPQVKKAELVEGVVHMPSPVRILRHGQPHGFIVTWVGVYLASTPGTIMGDNSTARLDLDNEPQPDVLLMIDPANGGQARISADDYIEDAPELVCEIAGSSESIDLHTKLNVYRRNGVREYLVWVTGSREVFWYVLAGSQYERLAPGADGLLRSTLFPGLWLDAGALTAGNLLRTLEVVRMGTESKEHKDFVLKITAAGAKP